MKFRYEFEEKIDFFSEKRIIKIKILDENFSDNLFEELPSLKEQDEFEIDKLDVSENKIKRINEKILTNFKKLKSINFSDNLIEELPSFIEEGNNIIYKLDFRRNKIKRINESFFKNFKNLESIDFSNNLIEELPSFFKEGEKTIRKLDFSRNRIKRINESFFKNFKKLSSINFSNNLIEELPLFNVDDKNVIDKLDFSGNRIKRINESFFKNFKKLESIEFSYNLIEELPLFDVDDKKVISGLDLSGNRIKRINKSLFKNFKYLYGINFSNNLIEELPLFNEDDENYIKILCFNGNRIKRINEEFFKNFKNLESIEFSNNLIEELPLFNVDYENVIFVLNFSGNRIKRINESFFKNFKKLESIEFSNNLIEELPLFNVDDENVINELDFSGNRIKGIDKSFLNNFKKLKKIDFSNNLIKEIYSFDIKEDTCIEIINFSGNLIKEIKETVSIFLYSKNLSELYLNKNRIRKLDINSLKDTKLKKLFLSDNSISSLPKDFFTVLKYLEKFNFSNNSLALSELFHFNSNFDFYRELSVEFKFNFLVQDFFNIIDPFKFDENFIKYEEAVKKDSIEKYDLRYKVDETIYLTNKKFKEIFNRHDLHDLSVEYLLRNRSFEFNFFIFLLNNLSFKKRDTRLVYENFITFNYSVLDLIIMFDIFKLNFILDLKNLFDDTIRNNLYKNFDFLIISSDSFEFLLERGEIELIDAFIINKKSESYIHNRKKYISKINFENCWKILLEKHNENLFIRYFIILKEYLEDFTKDEVNETRNFIFRVLKSHEFFIQFEWFDLIFYLLIDEFLQLFIFYEPKKSKDNKENYSNNGDIISSIIEKRKEIENNQNSDKESTTVEIFFKNLVEYPNDKIFEDSNFKKILDKSWKRLPSLIYNGLLLLYVMFLVFYSIYISEYKQLSSSWNSYSKIISLIFLIINSLFEASQIIYSVIQIKNAKFEKLYFFSKKNFMECITYSLGFLTIFLDYSQTNLILISVTIIFSYSVLVIKMDKFYHFGKYIRVIGKILRKANKLIIIVILFLIAFCLSFKNLEKNFSSDQDDYMSHFNTSYELGFFKTFTMMIGSLETDDMGLDKLNWFSFINFIIYGFFIYFMSLLLLNIFTGISIDEVNELFKSAEKDDSSNKIDYILKIEELKKIEKVGPLIKTLENFLTKIQNATKDFFQYKIFEPLLKILSIYDLYEKYKKFLADKSKKNNKEAFKVSEDNTIKILNEFNQLKIKMDEKQSRLERKIDQIRSKR